jgi:glycosyltransferase involved in cell wall biosynthesis
MRVVQVIPSLSVGGAERIASLLALELQRAGDEVSLISLYDPEGSWIEQELREAGVGLHFLGKRPGLDPRVPPRLARTFRSLRPHVIHTHLHGLKYSAMARAGRWRWPAIVHTIHNMAQREAEGLDRSLRQVLFRAGVVPVAIGDEVASSLEATYGIQPRWSIPNGIIVADFAARPGVGEAARQALGIEPGRPVLITAGRLNTQKNHALMLEAFADPRLEARDALLLICGDGDLRPALEEQARGLGIDQRVRFLGVVSNLPELLAASDAFILSSDWEGNPLVVMEAMAAGKPLLSTAVGCVPELISPQTGYLVAPGDRAGFSDALIELLSDPERLRGQGEAAAAVARERFDVSTMAEAYRGLYRSLVEPGKRGLGRGLGLRRGAR